MNKRFGVKNIYAICSLVFIIVGPLLMIAGILLLLFLPIGKLFSVFIVLIGIACLCRGKTVGMNEININDDYVYIKYGISFKTTEKKLEYKEINSVKGNAAGGVIFDTKMGIISVAYIDRAVECAELINYRLTNGKFDVENTTVEVKENTDISMDDKIEEKMKELSTNRPVRENEHKCKNCGHVQSKTIQRCLKCGQLIQMEK